jgi:hypothetical protein
MTDALTDQHQDAFKAQVWELRRQFEAFSLPLMIQSMLTFELFPRLIEHGVMYYSTRRPAELGAFTWVIDAKGAMETPTEWEEWWSRIVMPYVQTRSRKTPFNYLRIGDHTHLARFQVDPDGFTPTAASRWKEGDPLPLDLKAILMESFAFLSSSNLGLELVDILTNATRRAIIGNLKKPGWVRIPELMIHRKGRSYISVHVLQQMPTPQVLPYSHVLSAYGRTGRMMMPAHLRNKKF